MKISNNKIINGFLDFLCLPFRQELKFFIISFIISAIVDVIVYSCTASIFKAAFIGLHHYVICYFLTLLACVIPKYCRPFYKGLVFILLGLNFMIDFVCIYSFHSVFSEYFTSIFANTNSNEVLEFIRTYISSIHIVVFVLFFLMVYLLYHWKLRLVTISLDKRVALLGVFGAFFGIITIGAISTKNVCNVSIIKFYSLFKDTPPDLSSYICNPSLVIKETDRPRNLVVILGESFAKSHCSLYEYEKDTNPYLTSLRDSDLLYVFNDVTSPALNTIPSFQCMMSTYKPEYKDSVDWYKCITLHEILHKVGYETYWFSNQNKNGLWDNVVTQYAMLSDHVYFNGEKFAVKNKVDLDGDLIPLIKEYGDLNNTTDSQVYFIHLMGSHYDFDKRYPLNFARFNEKNYQDKDENQRAVLAKYDNSVLYNDSIVAEMIHLFDNEESLILYFPDHGLDIYESRKDYIGHAMYNNEVSSRAGSAIPFMIYMNKAFQQKYPMLKKRIEENVNLPFCTDDLIYTIMDILEVKFLQNNDVERFSLLRKYKL